MIRKLLVLSAIGAALIAASPPNAKQMAQLNYLVGTWHCEWSGGGQSGKEDQVFSLALGGAWIEEKEIVMKDGKPVVTTDHFTGYDPKNGKYMHLGPDASGSYEIADSPDATVWTSTDGKLIHTKISDTERKMSEGPIEMRCLKQ